MRLIISLFLLTGGIVSAQEDSSNQKGQDLFGQGHEAYQNGEYRKAIDAYLEAASYPEMEDWKGTIFYNVSCSYSLLGNGEKALEYLDSAAAAGYTDYRWPNQDQDFGFLRKNYPERFAEILDRIKAAKREEIIEKTPLCIVEYDNYNGPLDISGFAWEDINRPEMDTLRNAYHLSEVAGDNGTEFEKMKRLLNWVSTRWVHDGSKMAPERTALAILREVDEGKRFCCANYADVLIGCMRSLGYPIRFTGLRMDDAAYNMGGGHGCVEVWSNQYQKWIFLDVQNNAWWEHDGVPLNAYECHRLFADGKENELEFVGQHEQMDYLQAKPTWVRYFYRVVNYWMGQSLQLVSGLVTPGLLYQGNPENLDLTDQYDRVYPRLNRTTVTLRSEQRDALDSLTVILENTMPYFDRYQVRIDETDWQTAETPFQWILKPGLNTIEARAVNAAGIEGKPSRIVVRYNP